MKKIIAVILALVFILSLFAGCNKTPEDTQLSPENPPKSEEKGDGDNEDNKNETPDKNKEDNEVPDDNTNETNGTEVTDENVKELFIPSLEAYVCFAGSGLYELEKNDDGTVKTFGVNDNGDTIYKVIGYNDPDKVEADYRKYVSEDADAYGSFPSGCFIKDGGDLYVTDGAVGSIGYDKNSINLEKYENGKYYISVAAYAYDGYEPRFFSYMLFTVSVKNENLYIESEEYWEKTNYQTSNLKDKDLIDTFSKFGKE